MEQFFAREAKSNMPLQLLKKVWGIKIISPNSCYQSNQMIIPSAISQERLISKANYILPEKKSMNSYAGDILLLVQIPLALAFTSVHYCLNELIDFDQTGINTLLRGGDELFRFWWPLKCLIRYWQYENMSSSSPQLIGILASTG